MDLGEIIIRPLPYLSLTQTPVLSFIYALHHSSWHHGNPEYFPWQWGIVCQVLVMVIALGLLVRSQRPRVTGKGVAA